MANLKYYTRLRKGLSKALFYLEGFCTYCVPARHYRKRLQTLLNSLSPQERREVESRVNYYNRLPDGETVKNAEAEKDAPAMKNAVRVKNFKYPFGQKKKLATYFFDLYDSVKYFNPELQFAYLFGDVRHEPDTPSFVKSRPISAGRSNAVLLKLNKIRHYVFVKDKMSFSEKKDMIVSRNIVRQPHRKRFLKMYFDHPLCDVGQTNKDVEKGHEEWVKDFLSLSDQLQYKFICCIEGNDVATNLKWVMSSNSLAVMPRPRYETWFMEGSLIPNYHYVEIKPDYSNLIERMKHYIEHPEEAEAIIAHCHEYIRQFKDARKEKIISLLVLKKYFSCTKQF